MIEMGSVSSDATVCISCVAGYFKEGAGGGERLARDQMI